MGPTTRSAKTSVKETKQSDSNSSCSGQTVIEHSSNESNRKINLNFASNLVRQTSRRNQSKGSISNLPQTSTEEKIILTVPCYEDNPNWNVPRSSHQPGTASNIIQMNVVHKSLPRKKGSKLWHRKKNPTVPPPPMVAQGIPHIAESFIKKKQEEATELVEAVHEQSQSASLSVTQSGDKPAYKLETTPQTSNTEAVADKIMTIPADNPQIKKSTNMKNESEVTTENEVKENDCELIADEEPRMTNTHSPVVDLSIETDTIDQSGLYEDPRSENTFHHVSIDGDGKSKKYLKQKEHKLNTKNDKIDSSFRHNEGVVDTQYVCPETYQSHIEREKHLHVDQSNSETSTGSPSIDKSLQSKVVIEERSNTTAEVDMEKNLDTMAESLFDNSEKGFAEMIKKSTVGRVETVEVMKNSVTDKVQKPVADTVQGPVFDKMKVSTINERKESIIEEMKGPMPKKEIYKVEPPITKMKESKIEFISVYSSKDVKKKNLEPAKMPKESEQLPVMIGPLQPVLQLVDPEQLDKETEIFYTEVGAIPKSVQPNKPKCLTAKQVAKITKDYPQVNPDRSKNENSEEVQTAWAVMHQYWTFVQENPYDFDGWTRLLNHVESMNNIEAARSAFEGFLPLYPYCYAYWMKFSDLEMKFSDLEKALGVLYLGTKCVPFCTDLWVPLLNKFLEYAKKEDISEDVIRGVYEYTLDSLSLSWNSSSIWDVCINYELTKGDLVRVMNLYRRVLTIPTKLYNKHWDHLLALVRDYHPRNLLTIEEYSNLKKSACDLLKIKFNPPSLEAPTTILKVTQPEDKIHTTIKEKIVASLIPVHEANEQECEKRWKYEEKIKRPYFHVKPLEKKQLKTWREYLNFEIKNGDPVRIITLYERCLVPCAMYEEFWCKYASYMEDHVLNVMKKKYANVEYKPGYFNSTNSEEGIDNNKELTHGDKKTDDKKPISKEDNKGDKSNGENLENVEMNAEFWSPSSKKLEVSPEVKFEVGFLLNRLSEDLGVGTRVLTPPVLTPSSILRDITWEDVRQIYRRGAWIHCPNKPLILMQWAEFEEAQECIQTSRELLNTVLAKHSKLLKARLQLIELERRNKEMDRVDELYAQTFATFTETRIRSCIAIRYARFLFKIREEDDKALLILRKALKKDKGNVHLYHHVFDVCYQRRPIDCNGVLAAVMLALASKELSLEQKYLFCVKRSEFLREHGSMMQLKEAKAEMEDYKLKLEKGKSESEEGTKEEVKEEPKEKDSATKETDPIKNSAPATAQPKLLIDDCNPSDATVSRLNSSNKENSPLVALQHPPVPPILEPVLASSRREGKGDRSERRERRRRREESDGHRSSKRKSSRSSSHKKSKRDRRSNGRHREEREEGEMNDSDEDDAVYDANGVLLMGSTKDMQMQSEGSVSGAQPQLANQPQVPQDAIRLSDDKPYQAVPPSWDLNVPAMSTYGYAKSSELVKEGQNSLYERYYELIKQGYEARERERNAQVPSVTVARGNVILEANNSYLPPPPIPQGILGESLFNQGKLENLHNLDGNQGNLNPNPQSNFLIPPPTTCLGPAFANRPAGQQKIGGMDPPQHGMLSRQQQGPLNPMMEPIGMRMSNAPPINPALLQNNQQNYPSRGLLETPPSLSRQEAMPPAVALGNQEQMTLAQRNDGAVGHMNTFQGSKPLERDQLQSSRGSRGGRGRDRNRQQPNQNIQQTFNPQTTPDTSRPPPFMNLNPGREDKGKVALDNAAPAFNVPEWLVKEGGELRLSETSNGESFIRYWPRYMNQDGHETLFQSLRKSVKWFQRRQLVGSPSDNNWVNLPKLISWIGPCSYEKDGITLSDNTNWPPEVVDLLHRLIHFSNSSFNSCFLSLYNSGHSHHPWHSEAHEAMAKNPTTACISLGVTRTVEMKRKEGMEYLRFPLLPGSLFVMEGATHNDWLCQIPKEPHVSGERISLSFRTMLMIKGVTV